MGEKNGRSLRRGLFLCRLSGRNAVFDPTRFKHTQRKGVLAMTHFKHAFWQKQWLAAVLAVVLLLAAGCGAGSGNEAKDSAATPGDSEVTAAEPIDTSRAAEDPAESTPADEAPAAEKSAAEPAETPPKPLWEVGPEQARLNRFLTSIVQQDIVNTQTDLDEDAEMVRFVFGYRKTNDPTSILEQDDGEDICRTLTIEQVNETLTMLFGKSISPDQEDYSIIFDESEGFHCFYRDGVFRNVPPYPTERYPFPIRFALVSRIDEETFTLHFKLYQANPWIWGEDETERHLGVLPFMSFREAEGSDVISFLGEGDAILHDFGEDLQLIEMVGSLTR